MLWYFNLKKICFDLVVTKISYLLDSNFVVKDESSWQIISGRNSTFSSVTDIRFRADLQQEKWMADTV
jgi:hypothetical protein